jgi:hypothetical protein
MNTDSGFAMAVSPDQVDAIWADCENPSAALVIAAWL